MPAPDVQCREYSRFVLSELGFVALRLRYLDDGSFQRTRAVRIRLSEEHSRSYILESSLETRLHPLCVFINSDENSRRVGRDAGARRRGSWGGPRSCQRTLCSRGRRSRSRRDNARRVAKSGSSWACRSCGSTRACPPTYGAAIRVSFSVTYVTFLQRPDIWTIRYVPTYSVTGLRPALQNTLHRTPSESPDTSLTQSQNNTSRPNSANRYCELRR